MGIYTLYDKFYVYSLTGIGSRLVYASDTERIETMEREYKDAIAWLQIEDTIDEPVMQADTNSYYLNIGPDGKYSLRGSIFLDARNQGDFSDDYFLLYGHHMAHHQMFGALDHYFDEKYWSEAHKTGILLLNDKTEIKFTIFAIGSIDASVSQVFNPTEHSINDVISFLMTTQDMHIRTINNPEELAGKQIICLSTCQTPDSTLRTCVFGYIER